MFMLALISDYAVSVNYDVTAWISGASAACILVYLATPKKIAKFIIDDFINTF